MTHPVSIYKVGVGVVILLTTIYKKVKLAGRYEWSNHQTGLEILPPDAE
jgi:hypothetical protein